MRAILVEIPRQVISSLKKDCPRVRTGWFLFAAILFLLPSRSNAAVTVTISPTAVSLPANGSQQFTATVTGGTDTSVTWTILEGSSGGAISNAGLYSAPAVLGTYHVVATSNADNTQSATATVAISGFIHSGLLYAGSCTATLLSNGTVLYTGGQLAGLSSVSASGSDNAEIYDAAALASTPTGNMTIPRCDETATLLSNGKVLFAGGQTLGGATATAELYDPIAGTFASTGSMSVARSGHTATLLPSGQVLIAGGENCNSSCVVYGTAELYDPSSGTFTLTASNLTTPYTGAAAILLNTGKVLIAGGSPGGTSLNSFADLYDPATGSFTQTGAMVNPRESFTATLLQNGKVLFAGGDLMGAVVTASAEIYDPSTGTFAMTGSLSVPRDLHTASLLLNGQVLIAGGRSTITRPASAELYDPGTGTFLQTGNLEETRFGHTATSLSSGTVVVAAGSDGQLLGSIETYDPTAGVFSSQSVFMNVARAGHGTTQLADGRVLLTGGQDAYSNVNSSAEIYDPATGKFSLTGSLIQGRYGHTATLLGNGNVLVVGGYSDAGGSNLVATAELYNPVSGTFSSTSNPNVPRSYHTATLLQNGMVLIAGGVIAGQQTTTSVELYNPGAGSFTLAGDMSAPRYNHTATLLNDGRVLIAEGVSGSGGGFSNQVGPDDLYNPSTGLFTQVGSPFQYSESTIIPFDSVLLAGGQVLVDEGTIFNPATNTLSTFNPLNSLSALLHDYKFLLLPDGQVFVASGASAAYLFDPTLETYSPAGTMEYSRTSPTVKLLSNGEVLVAGGAAVTQAEFYLPSASASNASPVLSLINPSSAVSGGAGFTLLVYGSNFVSNSAVNLNGVARQTTYLSPTQLSIAILASDIANAGTLAITVTNPTSGAGGGTTSNPVTLTVSASSVQPVVGTMSPASATAGGPSFTLSLSGNNFTASSVVSFNGNTVPSTFLSVAELQASIPASAIAAAGTPIVTVSNPGSLPSVVVTFTVNNPVPQASLLSPSSAQSGGAALPMQVTGSNFNASSSVLINGAAVPTTYVSSTLLQATVPASDLTQSGTLSVLVNNPAPGGGTTSALPFTVTGSNLQPVVGTLSPASATAGGPSFTLSLSGNNFTTSSVVNFNGNTVPTTFSSVAQLQASVPASAIAVAGKPMVTVTNPGGIPSTVVTFTVNNPVPQASLLSPSSSVPGSAALPLQVTGSNFNASSVVLINGATLPTTYVSSTVLQATVPASDLTQSGTITISVNNPPPGGGTTPALAFAVADYTVSPSASSETVNAGQSGVFSLTVTPSNGIYPNPITFTATVSPAGPIASFTPSGPITPGTTSQAVTLTIATTPPTTASAAYFPGRGRPDVLLLCFVGMVFVLVGLVVGISGHRLRRLAPQLLWALLLMALAGLVACTGSVAGTPSAIQPNPAPGTSAATYTIIVTATSAISHSTSVTLTVM